MNLKTTTRAVAITAGIATLMSLCNLWLMKDRFGSSYLNSYNLQAASLVAMQGAITCFFTVLSLKQSVPEGKV